ncbi:MAG TPA: methionyl-tRNA formyltransferase [Candidatus Saccharimonadales bacterium]|nr:methionyl-tRNA formyltransferase [Candidatus Saccharimonadales bacterium]
MKNTSIKILFFGNERLVSGLKRTDAPVLKGLIERGYDIRAIISHHSNSHSRNQRLLEVAEIGKQNDIPVLLPSKPTDIFDQIAGYKADVAILVAYGRIIPQKIIDLFPMGIINIHPSLLPKYRGPTPIESAIINGDSQTGVSIMRLTAGMDSGPVYGQTAVPLSQTEDKFDAYGKLSQAGSELLFKLLPSILDGSLQPSNQNESEATYSPLLNKADGQLDLTTLTATQAERRIRAYLGFPKTNLIINNYSVIVTKAHTVKTKETSLDLECKDASYLHIDELIAPSGRIMDGEAFLRGYTA